jgi:hypothetical protein
MGRQLVIITETRKNKFFFFGRPDFYQEMDILPPQKDRNDPVENFMRVEIVNKIYNFVSSDLTPHELIHRGKLHHAESGEPCGDVCVCGHTASDITGNIHKLCIKTHSEAPMSFQKIPLPEYLERMEYNKKNNIAVKVELWDTDDQFNPISLIKTFN